MAAPSILTIDDGNLENNITQQNRFEMVFSVLPNVTYTLNEVNLPGINLNNPQSPTIFNTVWYEADSATFDQLNINFLIQEDFANYFELHDWMRAMSFPNSFEDRKDLERFKGVDSYGFLTINNSYNRPLFRFHFDNIMPNTLTALNLQASMAEDLFASATFNFTIYHRENVPQT